MQTEVTATDQIVTIVAFAKSGEPVAHLLHDGSSRAIETCYEWTKMGRRLEAHEPGTAPMPRAPRSQARAW